MINFGIDPKLSYWDARKAKLLNVIVFSISFILIIFLVINLVQKNYFLAISDVLLFVFVCIPSWILQLKKKYKANILMITCAFFFFTTLLTILKYDVNRQTEHILPAISIMVIFLFDGWKKNLIFLCFPISFFTIRFAVMHQTTGIIELEALHLIYFLEFLIVYVITSYFKADMIGFYNKLEMANQTKSKLFRIISHDLRNPFSSLLGVSELQSRFIESGDMDKLKTSSEIINSSANKIYDLTQSLLDWSMTQSEILEANIEKINLTDLIKQVVEFSNITAVHKDISIDFTPTEPIFCNCDNTMAQICLRNIIMNAIKFSDRNTKIIVSQHHNTNNIEIHVKDFGVGISEENLSKIFDNTTLHSSYGTENEKGTGLGIQICQELMEKQGGKLLAESNPDEGSIFKLQFIS